MIPLPIDEFLPEVTDAVRRGRDVVLVAQPGAGKTTRLAPALVRDGLDGHLVMLQPRRVAARAAAARIADEQGWTLGNEVGYQVRFERKLTNDTPLRVLTEGILTRRLVADPSLEGTAVVVLDEFHERSLDADLSLAMLREAKLALRDDLRIVVMSATLDAAAVATFLGEAGEVETLEVPGRLFPVDVEYAGTLAPPMQPHVTDAVLRELDRAGGDILAFLPGAGEIERVMRDVTPAATRAGFDVLPLHGGLSRQEQDAAVRPGKRPRVICATNIAETSLTLPGVRVVIDSGQVRQAGYDAARGVSTLSTRRISKASAEQRTGRAGRVAEGRCVRLWSKVQHAALDDYDTPEIARVELSQALLNLAAWGSTADDFGWYESPPAHHVTQARQLLRTLGALEDAAGGVQLTTVGKQLQTLPLDVRPARLLSSAPKSLRQEAATVAALLGEDLRVAGRGTMALDNLVRQFEQAKLDPLPMRSVGRAREVLLRLAERASADQAAIGATSINDLLLLAYPDRVCRRRTAETATLAGLGKDGGGGGIQLLDPAAAGGDWFLALDVTRGTGRAGTHATSAVARLVSPVDPERLRVLLPYLIETADTCTYDATADKVRGKRVTRYLNLPLAEHDAGRVDPVSAAEVLRGVWLPRAGEVIEARPEVVSLLARLDLVRACLPEHDWPELDRASLVASACEGATSRRNIEDALETAVRGALVYPLDRLLEEAAPTHVEVPTGSRIRLQYQPGGDAPILAVRVQEVLGLQQTPTVCQGRQSVLLHLLAPNQRPVQVTSDLAGFWTNSYPQVRKDLRARYSKHAWPEDPANATPIRGTKRQHERRSGSAYDAP